MSKHPYYFQVLRNLEPVLYVLETDIENAAANRGCEAKVRTLQDKGKEAREIRGKLRNQETVLQLTGVTDIYALYGKLVNVAQMFSLLPHQRFDLFMATLEEWEEMTQHFEDHQCSGGEDCKLSTFHSAVASLKIDGVVNKVLLLDKFPVQNAALNARTRRQRQDEDDGDEIVSTKVAAQLQKFSKELLEDIRVRAIKEEDIRIIELTRVILDFKSMIEKMRSKKLTPELFAASYFDEFINAARKLRIPSLGDFEESFLEKQFKTFMGKLDSFVPKDDKDVCKIDPLAIDQAASAGAGGSC